MARDVAPGAQPAACATRRNVRAAVLRGPHQSGSRQADGHFADCGGRYAAPRPQETSAGNYPARDRQREHPMNNEHFSRLLESVRQETAPAQAEREAASRGYARLEEAAALDGGPCAGFRAQFEAYRQRARGEKRAMLLQGHLHSWVAGRTRYHGDLKAGVISIVAP